jgi:hypothetical protein
MAKIKMMYRCLIDIIMRIYIANIFAQKSRLWSILDLDIFEMSLVYYA